MRNRLILGDGLLGSELIKQTGWDYISRKKDGIDFTIPNTYKSILSDYNEIINCVAHTATYDDNRNTHWNVNFDGVVNLVDICNELNKKLIHVSTDYIYAYSKIGVTENDVPVHCRSWYGYTKLLADGYVQLKSNDFLLLRGTHKITPFPYEKAWVNQIGNCDYVDVIAKKIIRLIENNATGIYNIGTDVKTIYQLAKKTRGEVRPMYELPNESTPTNLIMDVSKLENFLMEKRTMNKKLVIFGPWCGEFSYELSWWIPEIRKKRLEEYKDYDAIHIGFIGRGILYRDFIDQYMPYTKEIEDTLKYPATYGEHIPNTPRDGITPTLEEYTNSIVELMNSEYDEIVVYQPNTHPINQSRTLAENPYGIYKSYDISKVRVDDMAMRMELFFGDNRERVAIVARTRYRDQKTPNVNNEDWNPDRWEKFVERLITEMDLNIVVIEIERKYSRGGSLKFDLLWDKYPNRIMKINVDNVDYSVREQIAILKNTKCSIYGSTGAVVLPFFVNTPVFTQQCVNNAPRLKFEWQRKLTNNHKNVFIFDKYDKSNIYNSPVEEMFNKFKEYYGKL
ncbi:MAG: sugar nucleotide-binding protein [Bacteroidetes bacterium]|nr:sugar nucleotide-binding protein [Bacteroidota bacterium]